MLSPQPDRAKPEGISGVPAPIGPTQADTDPGLSPGSRQVGSETERGCWVQLLEVQNLIFVLPLAAGFLLILLMALGIPMGDHGVHMDVAVPHAELAHDLHAAEIGAFGAVLSFLGVGKVPFAVTMISGTLMWGVAGLVVNLLWPGDKLWFPAAVAATAAIIGTRWVSVALANLLPSVETYSVPASELVTLEAEVIHEIDQNGGNVRLTDRMGNLRDLNVIAGPTQGRIERGTRVILTEYDARADCFRAQPAGDALPGGIAGATAA